MRIAEATAAYEYQGFWGSFWDIIWWFLLVFVLISYLFALFAVIGDLFRDRKLNGWWKALWIVLLMFVPVLTMLVYLIVRGDGMGHRLVDETTRFQEEQDNYIRSVASTGPAAEIAHAKSLLTDGAITQAEYETLKAKALS